MRQEFPEKIILAGNICTQEGVKMLNELNIDIIKAGIGGGSACTTRIQTGIGMPQLSCIMECIEECYKYNNYLQVHKSFILSDGGITCPGDVAKSFWCRL